VVDLGAYERQIASVPAVVSVTPTSLAVSEEGETTDAFTVSLSAVPATNVTIQLTFDANIRVDTGAVSASRRRRSR
jgi:hypothetical protein